MQFNFVSSANYQLWSEGGDNVSEDRLAVSKTHKHDKDVHKQRQENTIFWLTLDKGAIVKVIANAIRNDVDNFMLWVQLVRNIELFYLDM